MRKTLEKKEIMNLLLIHLQRYFVTLFKPQYLKNEKRNRVTKVPVQVLDLCPSPSPSRTSTITSTDFQRSLQVFLKRKSLTLMYNK